MKKLKAFASLCALWIVLVLVYKFYFLIRGISYPFRLVIRFFRFRDKTTNYWVYHDKEPIFGPELYIAKAGLYEEAWCSGTYKECYQFIKKDKAQEKEKVHLWHKMRQKNKEPDEFFYDSEFNDYDDNTKTNSEMNFGSRFWTSY